MLTKAELKEQLDYNPETGVFTWKVATARRIKIGDIAGCIDNTGYLKISINCKRYLNHRLAWLYVYGVWPKGHIDHINGVRNDNRIENLRVVTVRQNQQNRKKHREGHLVGTSYYKRDKKWSSKIYINGKLKHIGSFETEQQAHDAYLNKLKELENE